MTSRRGTHPVHPQPTCDDGCVGRLLVCVRAIVQAKVDQNDWDGEEVGARIDDAAAWLDDSMTQEGRTLMPVATAHDQPDDMLLRYAAEVQAEMVRRGLVLDYEDLLRKYIWHIINCESVDFIRDAEHGEVGYNGHVSEFTADEIAELRRLSDLY